jgi:hypothetical protein
MLFPERVTLAASDTPVKTTGGTRAAVAKASLEGTPTAPKSSFAESHLRYLSLLSCPNKLLRKPLKLC